MENTLKHEILSSPMGKLTTTENSIGDEFARILEFKGRNFTIAMSAWFTVVNDHDVVKQSPVGEIYSCIRQTHMKRQPTGSDFNFIASIITWIARMICKSSLQWKTFFLFPLLFMLENFMRNGIVKTSRFISQHFLLITQQENVCSSSRRFGVADNFHHKMEPKHRTTSSKPKPSAWGLKSEHFSATSFMHNEMIIQFHRATKFSEFIHPFSLHFFTTRIDIRFPMMTRRNQIIKDKKNSSKSSTKKKHSYSRVVGWEDEVEGRAKINLFNFVAVFQEKSRIK